MRIIFITLSLLFIFTAGACAQDWKSLHERADKLTLNQALANVKSKPDSMDDLYVLALAYLNLHKNKEARETFDRILQSQPGMQPARWGIAEVLRRRHRLGKSKDILLEVIKSRSEFSPAYISLAYIEYTQMNFRDAVRLALKAIRQGRDKVDLSTYTRAYLIMAGSKGMLAHYGGPISKIVNGMAVLPALKYAQRLQPDSPEVAFRLGCFYLLAPGIAGGDIDKAIDYLERAIKIDPLFADAYVRLAQAYKVKGDTERYISYLDRSLQIDPDNELGLDIQSGKCNFLCVYTKQ
jgi:tetratricopeptide (TPR) repeat protein